MKKGLKDLLDSAQVTTLPVRIGRKPKGVTYPCAIIRAVASQNINTLNGTNATQQRLIQIDCWGNNPKEADELAKAVHAVLNSFQGTLSDGAYIQGCFPAGDVDLDDEELKCSGIAVEFSVWFIPGEFLSP
jgi:hypothetical protein